MPDFHVHTVGPRDALHGVEDRGGGEDGADRRLEDRERAVALAAVLEAASAVGRDDARDEVVVVLEGGVHARRRQLPLRGRADDVRQEEGDDLAGRVVGDARQRQLGEGLLGRGPQGDEAFHGGDRAGIGRPPYTGPRHRASADTSSEWAVLRSPSAAEVRATAASLSKSRASSSPGPRSRAAPASSHGRARDPSAPASADRCRSRTRRLSGTAPASVSAAARSAKGTGPSARDRRVRSRPCRSPSSTTCPESSTTWSGPRIRTSTCLPSWANLVGATVPAARRSSRHRRSGGSLDAGGAGCRSVAQVPGVRSFSVTAPHWMASLARRTRRDSPTSVWMPNLS